MIKDWSSFMIMFSKPLILVKGAQRNEKIKINCGTDYHMFSIIGVLP